MPHRLRSVVSRRTTFPPYSLIVKFATSADGTIGIEWELQLVDPVSGDLIGRADDVIASADDSRIKGEFFTNSIELVTGIHGGVDAAIEELRCLLDTTATVAEREGLALVGMGIHPTANWRDQEIAAPERYQRLRSKAAYWGRQQIILGAHTHVGVSDAETALVIQRSLMTSLPSVLALSASSPFWLGEDTGFDSQRTMVFQQLPNAGLPPLLRSWSDFERLVDDLTDCGAIQSVGELRWDVRPAPGFGTVESRIADGAATLTDLAAVAGLTACLAEEARRLHMAGEATADMPEWLIREHRWRAARYGLDAQITALAGTQQCTVRQWTEDAIRRLTPIAAEIGAANSLASAAHVLARGNAASRMRAAHRRGGHNAVIALLIDELQS